MNLNIDKLIEIAGPIAAFLTFLVAIKLFQ